ncbi:MAG: sporulation protein [Deltaproteobacteria bacterium]|nr:sporulation protein [Deltaproteobacteria bacterium]
MNEISDILEAVGEQVGDVASGDAVVGSPINVGAVTVYPISRLSLGLGVGGGSGDDLGRHGEAAGPQHGSGGGAGGGAKARPVALLVFAEEGVSVLPIADKAGKLELLLEKIPGLVERLKGLDSAKC